VNYFFYLHSLRNKCVFESGFVSLFDGRGDDGGLPLTALGGLDWIVFNFSHVDTTKKCTMRCENFATWIF
jgi:hypothetical protein